MTEDVRNESEGEFLYSARLVPAGREGNKVFARSLLPGEEDTGEGVYVGAGDQLVILAGGLRVSSDEIDALSPKGLGGYAPIANTVWTWYSIVGERVGFFNYLVALARRLDAAYFLWELGIQERDKARSADGVNRRLGSFRALAEAEVAIIALHRALEMLLRLDRVFLLEIEIPSNLKRLEIVIQEMRHAFEHIGERAQGMINQSGKMDAEALTIFDQPDFMDSSVLHYRGYDFDFYEDMLQALLSCRELVMKVIDLRAHEREADGPEEGL